MDKLKITLLVITSIVGMAYTDIIIWGHIFEANNLTQHAMKFHVGLFDVLFFFMIVSALASKSILDWAVYVMFTVVFALNGTEDILYYWLDGRSIPDYLPWLDSNILISPLRIPVTDRTIMFSAFLWLCLFTIWALYSGKKSLT